MAKSPSKSGSKPSETPSVRVICQKPGFRRAGVAHEADKTWPAGSFTEDELDLLRDEPLITLIEQPAGVVVDGTETPAV